MNNENFLPLLCFRFRWAGSDTVTSTSWRSVDTRTRPTSGSALSRRVRPRTGRCRSNSRKPETPDCTNVRYPPSRTAANSFDWMSSVSFCLLPIISCCCLPAVRAISALIRFKTLLDVWKTQTMPFFFFFFHCSASVRCCRFDCFTPTLSAAVADILSILPRTIYICRVDWSDGRPKRIPSLFRLASTVALVSTSRVSSSFFFLIMFACVCLCVPSQNFFQFYI